MNRLLTAMPIVIIAAYMTVGHVTDFRTPIMRPATTLLALAISAIVYALERRGAASAIDKSFALFMCFAAAVFWISPNTLGRTMADFSGATLYAVLFLAAAVPPLLGREPFTAHFARRVAPEAVWETDIFKRINLNLNWMWTAIFGTCVLSALMPGLVPYFGGRAATIAFTTVVPLGLILGIGITFSRYYPDRFQRKMGLTPLMAYAPKVAAPIEPSRRPLNHSTQEDTSMEKPKVVAINGSPHVSFGNSGLMMEMLRESLESHGMDLEVIHLSELRIEYCIGCAMCLEKGSCWISDDYKATAQKLSAAEAVVLSSPVYIRNVTAQMKTFLDRSLGSGHRPVGSWKPGLAISVSAGWGETSVAEYLGTMLRLFGAFPVGSFTAIAVGPGGFLGKDSVEQRAQDLARDLAVAVKEKRRYPATDRDLDFWTFMRWLVHENSDIMKADHAHWEKMDLYGSFEGYVDQDRSAVARDPEARRAWINSHIEQQKKLRRGSASPTVKRGPKSAGSARELLEMMPLGLDPSAAAGLSAVYQFNICGDEDFTAHLTIADQKASFQEGPAEKASVTVITPADVWLKIARGELDGAQAFMSGKYKVEGDIGLLMKLKSLFPG